VFELLFPVAADGPMPVFDDEASVAPQHIMKSRSRRAIAKENLFYVRVRPCLGTDDARMLVFGSIDSTRADILLSGNLRSVEVGILWRIAALHGSSDCVRSSVICLVSRKHLQGGNFLIRRE
jgi:hypothetical protein